MVVIKIRYRKLGAHMHCQMYTSSGGLDGSFGLNGGLVFSEAEWPDVFDKLNSVVQMIPESTYDRFDERVDERNDAKSRAGL
jgi:hypothetical protein